MNEYDFAEIMIFNKNCQPSFPLMFIYTWDKGEKLECTYYRG